MSRALAFKEGVNSNKKLNANVKEMALCLTVVVMIILHIFSFQKHITSNKAHEIKVKISHIKVLGLFDAFPDSDHVFWVDDMHASVNFAVQYLNHKVHAMVEGA